MKSTSNITSYFKSKYLEHNRFRNSLFEAYLFTDIESCRHKNKEGSKNTKKNQKLYQFWLITITITSRPKNIVSCLDPIFVTICYIQYTASAWQINPRKLPAFSLVKLKLKMKQWLVQILTRYIWNAYVKVSWIESLFRFFVFIHVRHHKMWTFRNYLHEANSKFQVNRLRFN